MSTTRIVLDPAFVVGTIDRRIFGSFVEHLGRCVYDGIYEPGHDAADEHGFRTDVIDLVKELGTTAIRYPGGNFVSGYRWEDGVGPVESRPRRLDLAWHSTETNEVGLHEFAGWLERVGGELMLAVNLGSRGVEAAVDLVEYANVPAGTALSDLRRANGREEPFGIRMWCLGNEMDGPWQVGHRSAAEYASIASQAASAMKMVDDRLQLVVCGSSGSSMPTFGTWERTVLEQAYETVDFVSAHAYYEPQDGDEASFLASGADIDFFVDSVTAVADGVKAQLHSDHTIQISFDEWNVWYVSRWNAVEGTFPIDEWPVAPRLLEDAYSVLDAVAFGGLLIALLRHADRVRSASLAQLVNVIAPIMTEPGGIAWRQTTFFPFAVTSRLARGEVLDVRIAGPVTPTAKYGDVSAVDAVATRDAGSGAVAVFLVNRSREEQTVTVDLRSAAVAAVAEAHLLADDDLGARNTLADPERVGLRVLDASIADGTLTVVLPAVSWGAVSLTA